jgi:dTDP-4-dehydrorhamnose reductase
MKKKILVLGGSGMVGSRFIQLLSSKYDFNAPNSDQIDVLDKTALENFLSKDADVVINFAAFTNVQKAEEEKDNKDGLVYKLNAQAVKDIAEICKVQGKYLVHFSTEYVFDGQKKDAPYDEDDKPAPINWYGMTKLFGEQFLLESGTEALLVRISMPFCANYSEKADIARKFVQFLTEGREIQAINDVKITPPFIDDLVQALDKLIEGRSNGIYHLGPTDSVSPYQFVKLIAQVFNLDDSKVSEISYKEYTKGINSTLLKNSWLSSEKFRKEFDEGILKTVEEEIIELKNQLS